MADHRRYGMIVEPFPRPSHPTPSTALRPPYPLPSPLPQAKHPDQLTFPARASRPALRIITNPTPSSPTTHQPKPVRHPLFVKSAPLVAPAITPIYPSLAMVQLWQAQLDTANIAGDDPVPALVVTVSPPRSPVRLAREGKGHKRRLSDKFKHLFSALHPKKEGRVQIHLHTSDDVMNTQDVEEYDRVYGIDGCGKDENEARKDNSDAYPPRPHRSPGTASFLVTRHPISSTVPTNPRYPSGPASTPSPSPSPSFGCTVPHPRSSIYLEAPMEISHFSNPTTLDSARGSTRSGRSVSSGEVLDQSPAGMQVRLGLEEGVRVRAVLRKTRSLPNLTSVVW